MKPHPSKKLFALPCALALLSMRAEAGAATLDRIDFGSAQSEQSHQMTAAHSDTLSGLLNEPARRLLPDSTPNWQGGALTFSMKVDPDKQNYFTGRFSGDDVANGRLMLYVDGKQIGWRHLGEVDPLDVGTWEAAYPGRFYYNTLPLPMDLTRGKTQVQFEIRSTGQLWGYASKFEQLQHNMDQPSRGIYRVYTHTDGCFVPPADEKQGEAPANSPVRASPGAEVLDQIKDRVNGEIDARLDSKKPLSQMQLQLLAKAYDVKWTHAYQNPKAIAQIVKGLDGLFADYKKNPKLAQADPTTWNPDWFGLGVCGQVISLRQEQLKSVLDEKISNGEGQQIARRAAWTQMLVDCRDWHRQNRRLYTNQTMLNDTNGIYLANRGIEVLDPSKALSEPDVKRYLYESVGLQPWTDSDAGGHKWNTVSNYMQITDKGLTRELGYVGTYGEVIDLVSEIYDVTRPTPDEPGDEKIKSQLVKIALARTQFRYPTVDGQGNRAMRLEQVVGWRDAHYPGEVAYAQRATRDASAIEAAAVTLDPRLVGYAQQMIGDNQFFASEVEAMDDHAQPLRTTIGRLATPDEYALITDQPSSDKRLPMSNGQPNYIFSDEQDGVLGLKNGDETLYVSLYWRARFGINNLARVHDVMPRYDKIAVVHEDTKFDPSGMVFTWPNWTDFAFGNGGIKYPSYDVQSAYAGEKQPIAKIPQGVPFKPGQESPYAGKGQFYELRYGSYLIGMNMTTDQSFPLKVPADVKSAKEFPSDKGVEAGSTLTVKPRSTVVVLLGGDTSETADIVPTQR